MFRKKGRWVTVELEEIEMVLRNVRRHGGFRDREFGLDIEGIRIDVRCRNKLDGESGFWYQMFIPEHVFRNISYDEQIERLFDES